MTKLKQEDIDWIESRINRAASGAVLVAPRPEFVQRAKAELMDLPVPEPARTRQLTLWAALILAVAAIFAAIWYLTRRSRRPIPRASANIAVP